MFVLKLNKGEIMIEISSIRLKSITVNNTASGTEVSGSYELVSQKGKVIAVQSFNGYSDMKFNFDSSMVKCFLNDIESHIEIEIGVQEVIKKAKEIK